MKNKIRFFIIVAVITLLTTALTTTYYSFTEIIDASVDDNTGNVTIAHYRDSGFVIQTFNNNGEKIFGQHLYANGGGGVYVEYIDECLYLFVSKIDTLYIYDQSMNLISKEVDPDRESDLMKAIIDSEWSGWKKSGKTRQYTNGNNKYCYTVSSFWRRIVGMGSCQMYIEDEEGTVIQIYYSDKRK